MFFCSFSMSISMLLLIWIFSKSRIQNLRSCFSETWCNVVKVINHFPPPATGWRFSQMDFSSWLDLDLFSRNIKRVTMSGLVLSGGTLVNALQGKRVYQPIWQIIAIQNSVPGTSSSQLLVSDGEILKVVNSNAIYVCIFRKAAELQCRPPPHLSHNIW